MIEDSYKPAFSIVMPTFNSEGTLQRALNSLKIQTFGNFEVLIIDGLSIDNTKEIAAAYYENDRRFRFIQEKDSGIYDAMNKGIANASGDWIYFLGSDDFLANDDVLKNIYHFTNNGAFDIIYGYITSAKYGKYGGVFTCKDLLLKNISHQSMFFKKSVFGTYGVYNTRFRTHADWEFNLRCLCNQNISTKYIDLNIATYATAGASSRHEILFFREVLLPLKLSAFLSSSQTDFKSLNKFDEWWRFIRNAEIRSDVEMQTFAPEITIPDFLIKIINEQKKWSPKTLMNGIFSKYLMTISYIKYSYFRLFNNK